MASSVVAGRLVENRQHMEAACLLTDYANVRTSVVSYRFINCYFVRFISFIL